MHGSMVYVMNCFIYSVMRFQSNNQLLFKERSLKLNYCHQSDCVPYVQLPFAFVEKRNSEVTWCSWYLLYDFWKTDNADMINSDNWITTMLKIQ